MLSEVGHNVRQEGGVLIFSKIQRSDAGRYSCHVSNTMGEDRIEMELFVEGKQDYLCHKGQLIQTHNIEPYFAIHQDFMLKPP